MVAQIITRAEAKSQGLARYFTGKPCKRGHLSERRTGCSVCLSCRVIYIKSYIENNRERTNEIANNWKKRNVTYNRYNCAKRKAAKLQATPSWANLEAIKEVYKTCPTQHHVDHIVPLKSDTVCGLHVPWNLEHLPISDNLSKGNRYWPNNWD